jgi:hypothetical protein
MQQPARQEAQGMRSVQQDKRQQREALVEKQKHNNQPQKRAGENNEVAAGKGRRVEWVPIMITSVATAAPAVAMTAAVALAIASTVTTVCEDINYSIILSINLVTKT